MIEERIGDQVVTARYAFDGQLESLGTNAGEVLFAYDGDRRLTRVQDWSGASQYFSYDGADQSQLRELPGLREQRTLTPVGFTAQVVTHASPSGALQMWQQYAHDANDRVVPEIRWSLRPARIHTSIVTMIRSAAAIRPAS